MDFEFEKDFVFRTIFACLILTSFLVCFHGGKFEFSKLSFLLYFDEFSW